MASGLCAFANNKVDEFRKWKYSSPAGDTYAEGGDEDEERAEDKLCFSEEGETKVDEDEILGELGENLEKVFGCELGTARHVIVGIVF